MGTEDRALGPIDIVIIGYPKDSPLTGEAGDAVIELVERGVIRVLDALFVHKNADGSFSGIAARDLTQESVGAFVVFDGASSGLLDEADAGTVAEALEPGEAALIIMFENSWAAPFVQAVRNNGGKLLDFQRIPASEVLDALDRVAAG